MRIVLHIGTHKTGTSSIQNFLARNRRALLDHGVHYPLSLSRSGRNVNFLAADIAAGRVDAARAFLHDAAAEGRRKGAHTLLLSAESFYAMTGFFHNLLDRPVADYWAHERACVARVADLCGEAGAAAAPRVVVYLRRPDRFVESMYGQFVKQTPGYTREIDSFIDEAGPIDAYAGHLDAWAGTFGADAVVARRFQDAVSRLEDDFLEMALGITDTTDFEPPGEPVNESLDPAALAFKRVINRLRPPAAEGYVLARTVTRVAREQGDTGDQGALLEPAARRVLLARNVEDEARVARDYLVPSDSILFDTPGSMPEAAPGLDTETGVELLLRLESELARPAVRGEILARRLVRGMLARFPGLEKALGGVRRLVNRRRVRLESEGSA